MCPRTVISRSEHDISRANISKNAIKVLYRLNKAGFEAYLVGGSVRDLLLGREPKDFDVATSARPEQVKKLFRNCRLIGRRFRLAHVHFGIEIVEVATFRAHHDMGEEGEGHTVNGRIVRDNVYGDLEMDAVRRDFTINALYYDIRDFSLVDFSTGVKDLRDGVLRFIGDPETRVHEDPVRMLRVVRFAAKLGFRIQPEIEAAMSQVAGLLADMPPARLYDEVIKIFHGGYALQAFELLRHYGLFGYMFPASDECLEQQEEGFPRVLIANALRNTDMRITEGKPVTPAFLFAALLWEPMVQRMQEYKASGMHDVDAMRVAANDVLAEQARRISVPRRFSQVSREIWALQPRLAMNHGKRAMRLLANPRFRAAYDFLLLRGESGEDVRALGEWWTTFQEEDEEKRAAMLKSGGHQGRRKRRHRSRRKVAG
ncbi:MAG: polynucleotide adenylyltransferase PcnB [Gammaproteobacteria bacterium]|nr:polynucleotide adenylyltransferase PcnB [Gammaproteobacteria bacterium]